MIPRMGQPTDSRRVTVRHRARTRRAEETDHGRLTAALATAEGLLPVLSELMPERGGQASRTGTVNRHAPGGSEPWQAEAADAFWRIHGGIRALANELRAGRGLSPIVWRGHDDATDRVFRLVANFVPGAPDDVVSDALARVEGWVESAQQITDIDEVERWVPVPRLPGGRPPACPFCETFGLRMTRRGGRVRCFFPQCVDSEGRPTRARMELGVMTGEGVLVFTDGTTMPPQEAPG